MARDPLRILLAVREHEVEQARLRLASCLKAEADALALVRSFEDAIRREHEVNATWPDASQFRDIASMRLAFLQDKRAGASEDAAAAAARSAKARDSVTAARTAAEAVEWLIEKRQAASNLAMQAREQHTLDDIARARLAQRQRNAAL